MYRIASVSYLNARPLVYGLEASTDVELTLDVPSRLLEGLRESRFDVALLPVIDYQRMDGLVLIPAGGIGSDGQTLTVRIFSRVPATRICSLACDPDSHTSVALARLVLAQRYNTRPEFMGLTSSASADAMLLIGDKVVCDEPRGFAHQLDLGAEWKQMSGLPFVFAAWMARQDARLGDLPQRLDVARRQGMAHLEDIVKRFAVPRGWPAELAQRYLSTHLNFEIGPRQLEAIELFHRLAAEQGIIPAPPRPLKLYSM